MAKLECLFDGPTTGAKASVIWLHGLGADGYDFQPIAPELQLPDSTRFVFPHAPHRSVTINGGMKMRAWYDILETGLQARQDEKGVRESSVAIEALIAQERELGVPASRIFLAGFSQGGAMTLFTGLRYPERLAGLIVLSAYLPIHEVTLAEVHPASKEVPIFMAHGTYDPMVPMAIGEKSYEGLKERGYSLTWKTYPMPHSVCPEEIRDIRTWMKAQLATAIAD